MRKAIEARRVGFTLIELLVVIAIIGLLVSLILVASADGVRRAEERATQALITKLETALNDRYDALLNTQAPINQTHRFLAAINAPNPNLNNVYLPIGNSTNNSDDRRAQVIAQFDFIRAELPDVFFRNSLTQDGGSILTSGSVASSYPLNFAAAPYPTNTNTFTSGFSASQDGGSWALPLGNNYPGLPLNPSNGQLYSPVTNLIANYPPLPKTGMFGASFSAAGGIYKNLGYIPKGYDGVDNDNNGLIDDLPEGLPPGMTLAAFQVQVDQQLAKHTHKTARSEMLYAVLVEGLSPLGSSFGRDDFTAREVMDTDGDGLPEFVDAWGEPIQFFRWPTYYGGPQPNGLVFGTSDSQLGFAQYNNSSQSRQQNQLDPNQLLVSPGWWALAANPFLTLSQGNFAPPNPSSSPSTNLCGPGAIAFMNYFQSLVDPNYGPSAQSLNQYNGTLWDRGNKFTRREFFTKFLILSAGPDHEPGVAQFGKDYYPLLDDPSSLPNNPYVVGMPSNFPNGQTIEQAARLLIYVENQAAVSDPVVRIGTSGGSFYEIATLPSVVTTYLSTTANSDDITNHNISGISTGVR